MNRMLDGMREMKGYIPWVDQFKRKKGGGNHDSCRIILVGCGISKLWGNRERCPFPVDS